MTRLTGKPAPHFTATAIHEGKITQFDTKNCLGKKWLLFFYPWDYSFTCPEELSDFQQYALAFELLDIKVVVSMTKDPFTVQAFLHSCTNDCSIENLSFPILSDENGKIAKLLNVDTTEKQISYRASFFIDEKGIVRQELVNDLGIRRSALEAIRSIHSWIEFQERWGAA